MVGDDSLRNKADWTSRISHEAELTILRNQVAQWRGLAEVLQRTLELNLAQYEREQALSHAAGQEATTNPAEIGRKSVGEEAVAYIVPVARVTQDGSYEDGPSELCFADEADDYVRRVGAPLYLTPAQPPASAEVGRDAVMAWPEGWKIEHTDNAKWPLRITEPHGINAWEMDAGNLACRFLIAAMAASSGRKGGQNG